MQTGPGIRTKRSGLCIQDGLWDYDGSCVPRENSREWNIGFSVGVFQWVAKSSGYGFKRSAAVKRFAGPVNDAESVYAKAEAYCRKMEDFQRPLGEEEK